MTVASDSKLTQIKLAPRMAGASLGPRFLTGSFSTEEPLHLQSLQTFTGVRNVFSLVHRAVTPEVFPPRTRMQLKIKAKLLKTS